MKNKFTRSAAVFGTILALCTSPLPAFASPQPVVEDTVATAGSTNEKGTVIDEAVDQVDANDQVQDTDAVADNIKSILNASAQISEASEDQLTELQSSIDTVTGQYDSLTEEEKDALSQSKNLLDSAKEAVTAMTDAASAKEDGSSVTIEQTGKENSFRYVNGEKISDAIHTVDKEQDEAASVNSEESEEGSSGQESEKSEKETESDPEEEGLVGGSSAGFPGSSSVSGDDEQQNSTGNGNLANDTDSEGENERAANTGSSVSGSASSAADGSSGSARGGSGSEAGNESASEDSQASGVGTGISDLANVEGQAAVASLLGSSEETGTLTSFGTYKGVDVSEHNGTIDWAKVKKAGINFAILRCGYGDNASYQDDKKWAYNVAQCEKYGIPYGVYLYSYATTTSQIDSEVQHVLRLLKGHSPKLPVYIDIEENAQFALGADVLSSFANRFCDKVSSAGYKAGLYSSTSYWEGYFSNYTILPNYYHWVAQVYKKCTYSEPKEMWQHSFTGKVDGIPTSVDMDLWYGDLGAKAETSGSYGVVSNGLYYIRNASKPSCAVAVDDRKANENCANVLVKTSSGAKTQAFTFARLKNGCYTILCQGSGKVVDVSAGSAANGANIQQYTGNGTYAQQWIPRANADGTVTLINAGSFKCMDIASGKIVNGSNIQQYTSNGTAAQKFVLTTSAGSSGVSNGGSSNNSGSGNSSSSSFGSTDLMGSASDLEGTYYIASYKHQNLVLDVAGASRANSANVQLYKLNKTGAQKFTLKYLGNGYYRITNVNSGKVLDVSGASTRNEANVQQYASNNTYAQQWKVVQNSDHTFTFICRVSGKALDISGASYRNGANIQQYASNGTYAQKFVLLDVNLY